MFKQFFLKMVLETQNTTYSIVTTLLAVVTLILMYVLGMEHSENTLAFLGVVVALVTILMGTGQLYMGLGGFLEKWVDSSNTSLRKKAEADLAECTNKLEASQTMKRDMPDNGAGEHSDDNDDNGVKIVVQKNRRVPE